MQEDEVSIVKVTRKPRKCVNCGRRVVLILYGMPSPIRMELIDSGKRIMGGCCVTDNDPQWGCLNCDTIYLKEQK